MDNIIAESLFFGFITMLIGSVVIKIIIKFNEIEHNDSIIINDYLKKLDSKYIIEIALFVTGISIHLLFEYSGFNNWYCEKECVDDVCQMICRKKI
jgi:hypothetical protein